MQRFTRGQLQEKENLEWFAPGLFKQFPPQLGEFESYLWPGWTGLLTNEDGTPIPEHIKNFIAREIFRGQDKELANRVYEDVCQKYVAGFLA